MTKVAVCAGGELAGFAGDYDVFVGVDAGCLFLLENGLPLDMAVGDFDSVTAPEWQLIQSQAQELFRAPTEKDDTDLEMALKQVFARFPAAQVTVFGAFGGRMDHTLSNLFLVSEPDLAPYIRQIQLKDAVNLVTYYPAGRHRISPVEGMAYVAFLPSDDSHLTIEQAKYPLTKDNYFFKKCYSSNEFIGKDIEIALDKGYVVVMYSKDRS